MNNSNEGGGPRQNVNLPAGDGDLNSNGSVADDQYIAEVALLANDRPSQNLSESSIQAQVARINRVHASNIIEHNLGRQLFQ